jgi:hypothetical protein
VSRKRYQWAIGTDVILIIAFVIICAASYRVYIHGAYNGDAIHCVPELFNESYDYESSDSSFQDELAQVDDIDMLEDEITSFLPLHDEERYNHTILNPELNQRILSVGS